MRALIALCVLAAILITALWITSGDKGNDSSDNPSNLEIEEAGHGTQLPAKADTAKSPAIETQPFQANAEPPVADQALTRGTAQVFVLDETEKPVHGARVLALPGLDHVKPGDPPCYSLTNAEGVASLGIGSELEWIIVKAPDSLPIATKAVEGIPTRIVLPAATISGTFLDSRKSRRPRCGFFAASVPSPFETWPSAARSHLTNLGFLESRVRIDVSEAGKFRLVGVPSGYQVVLMGEGNYRRRMPDGTLGPAEWTITSPSLDLVLVATRPLGIVGAFQLPETEPTVDANGIEEGVPPVTVDYEIPHESGEVQTGSLTVQSGEEFFIELLGAPRGEASLRFRIMATTTWLRSLRVAVLYDDVTDIGVVRPNRRSQERPLLVLDAQRRPISGAVATCGGVIFSPTDNQGWGTVSLPPGGAEVRVGALGYEAKTVTTDDSSTDPIEVQLFSANSLTVTASPELPASHVRGLFLTLRVHVPSPSRQEDARIGFMQTRGPSPTESSFGAESHALTYALDDEGHLKLYDLITTLPHHWTLADGYGHVVASGVTSIAMGEQAELRIPVKISGQPVRISAIREDGTTIPDFKVWLGSSPVSTKAQRTELGDLVLRNVYTSEALVEISAHGFASRLMKLRPQDEPHRVQLSPSARRWLEITDAGGTPVDGSFQVMTGPSEWRFVRREGPGVFFSDDLGEAVEVRLRLGTSSDDQGRRFTLNGERTRIVWN